MEQTKFLYYTNLIMDSKQDELEYAFCLGMLTGFATTIFVVMGVAILIYTNR